jgi:hypothetical protein
MVRILVVRVLAGVTVSVLGRNHFGNGRAIRAVRRVRAALRRIGDT